jgi:uncharacterized protein (TIGR03086 family)
MDLLDAHGQAMAHFDRAVHAVRPDQWQAPTPCTEWSVRKLVNHLVYEQLWAPPLLAGATVAEVGDRFDGDVLGDDPVATWQTASAAARAAFTEPGVLDRDVHVSWGKIPAQEYGWQMTIDFAVHGWDLATAVGLPIALGDELAGAVLAQIEPQVATWQGMGVFAPPVPVAPDADQQTKLVALLGRDPNWPA